MLTLVVVLGAGSLALASACGGSQTRQERAVERAEDRTEAAEVRVEAAEADLERARAAEEVLDENDPEAVEDADAILDETE